MEAGEGSRAPTRIFNGLHEVKSPAVKFFTASCAVGDVRSLHELTTPKNY
jgi:hypothetical protein